jgi:hypothetical protein
VQSRQGDASTRLPEAACSAQLVDGSEDVRRFRAGRVIRVDEGPTNHADAVDDVGGGQRERTRVAVVDALEVETWASKPPVRSGGPAQNQRRCHPSTARRQRRNTTRLLFIRLLLRRLHGKVRESLCTAGNTGLDATRSRHGVMNAPRRRLDRETVFARYSESARITFKADADFPCSPMMAGCQVGRSWSII